MKVHTIKFNLETALQIQEGKISGVIRTKGGYKATILATDLDNADPLAVRHYECSVGGDSSIEYVDEYSIDGMYWDGSDTCRPNDLVIDLWE